MYTSPNSKGLITPVGLSSAINCVEMTFALKEIIKDV